MLKFIIQLPLNSKLKYLKSKSFYDNNYFLLEEYGDWISFGDNNNNNILKEKYDEFSNLYTYYFGRFENDKFISVFGFCSDDDLLKDIEVENIY